MAAWDRGSGPTLEDLEGVVYLQLLESAPGSPALLLGLAVVDVPLVLAGAAHPMLVPGRRMAKCSLEDQFLFP